MKKTTNENVNHSLETARGFIKTAREYAHYKKTEGYNDDNFSFLEIVNLDASLDVCRRGPADYYFEKAYDLLCNELGKDHRSYQWILSTKSHRLRSCLYLSHHILAHRTSLHMLHGENIL